MKLRWMIGGAALSLASGWALAQNAPESLLPPGFDNPAPAPAPAPAPTRAPTRTPSPAPAEPGGGNTPATSVSRPVVQALPSGSGASNSGSSGGSASAASPAPEPPEVIAKLPTLEELRTMTPEEFEDVLGLKPSFDIPPAARRATEEVGIIGMQEGGFSPNSLNGVSASLVRRVLTGNRGQLVSRWGHILMRRALASRLDAPEGMNPADFAAMRTGVLLRMGEMDAARFLVQDVDTDNYTAMLTNASFDAHVATADFTGMCPVLIKRRTTRSDPKWEAANEICSAVRGDGRSALSRLDRSLRNDRMDRIDLLLAQRYAGAGGNSRRAVTIEWDGVNAMTPWRYGLAIAVGLQPAEKLINYDSRHYSGAAALAPMLGLADRAAAADRAGGMGILSNAALVDLYGQIYSDSDLTGDVSERAETLRGAYLLRDPSARIVAMQTLWNSASSPLERYSRQVLTASAAARLPVDPQLRDQADELIASMLSAGLDRNAIRWADIVEPGGQGWALLALGAPGGAIEIGESALDSYVDNDKSPDLRKSAFLVAGLAGLGRIGAGTKSSYESRLGIDLDRQSRWTGLIGTAARQDRKAMVAMLVALGMQGSGWDKMTPRYLFHIVSALRGAGLEAEARMIAAEAVARG